MNICNFFTFTFLATRLFVSDHYSGSASSLQQQQLLISIFSKSGVRSNLPFGSLLCHTHIYKCMRVQCVKRTRTAGPRSPYHPRPSNSWPQEKTSVGRAERMHPLYRPTTLRTLFLSLSLFRVQCHVIYTEILKNLCIVCGSRESNDEYTAYSRNCGEQTMLRLACWCGDLDVIACLRPSRRHTRCFHNAIHRKQNIWSSYSLAPYENIGFFMN